MCYQPIVEPGVNNFHNLSINSSHQSKVSKVYPITSEKLHMNTKLDRDHIGTTPSAHRSNYDKTS